MSIKRRIKVSIVVWGISFVAMVCVFLVLFWQLAIGFHKQVYKKSEENIVILDSVRKIEGALVLQHNSLFRFLQTGDAKWSGYALHAQKSALSQFERLEEKNKAVFSDWVSVENFSASQPEEKLREVLQDFQTDAVDMSHFQRLFYLTQYHAQLMFEDAKQRLSEDSGKGSTTVNFEKEEDALEILLQALSQIRSSYSGMFWREEHERTKDFDARVGGYLFGLCLGSFFLLVMLGLIWRKVFRFMKSLGEREEKLVMLGVRDEATGLFSGAIADILVGQELERARRHNRSLHLLAVRICNLDEVQEKAGMDGVSRLLFQVADLLRGYSRCYDGIYRISDDVLLMRFSEIPMKNIDAIITRFRKSIVKNRFVIGMKKEKISPAITFAHIAFPEEGDSFAVLLEKLLAKVGRGPVENWDSEPVQDGEQVELPVVGSVEASESVVATPEVQEPSPEISIAGSTQIESAQVTHSPIGQELKPQNSVADEEENTVSEAVNFESEKNTASETQQLETAPTEFESKSDEGGEVDLSKSETQLSSESVAVNSVDEVASEEEVLNEILDVPEMPADLNTFAPERIDKIEQKPNAEVFTDLQNVVRDQLDGEILVSSSGPQPAFVEEDQNNVKVSGIQVVSDAGGEDVIMVDFESEKQDLAQRFRKRIKKINQK